MIKFNGKPFMTLLRNLSFIRVISIKKRHNFSFAVFTAFFLLPFSLCWAGGKKDNDAQTQQQQAVPVLLFLHLSLIIYWTGDGGKGIKLAVLEPSGKGLAETEEWMSSMVQGSIIRYFQKYSAMTIIDRQNLEKSSAKQSLSGNYKDENYISIGKLTNARYILAGSITKTASAFMLELAITDAESGERKASYPPRAVSPFALENLSAAKEATAELLRQLGVNLTEQGQKEFNSEANTAQIWAEIALAKGIAAQKQGTVVEALSYFIQAANYDSGLTEAANRMNVLNASISSGNIGEDNRNDIAWRREWVKRLQETETFFANTIKEHQPFYIVYSTDIQKGKIDYQKETIILSVRLGFYPDFTWSDHINGVLTAVNNGLQATGRAQVWELDWPVKTVSTPSPFGYQTKDSTAAVIIEILNNEGKSIGRQTVKAPYGFDIKYTRVIPLWQWEGNVSFPAVDANLITDKLTIRIASIDGLAAENAARQKKISIMPETEWEALLQKNPAVKRNIEAARYISRGRAYLEKKDYDKALADYTQAINLEPKNADHYISRGDAYYFYKEDYDRAIADFTQAINLEPKNADHYISRGDAYLEKKDYNKAFADYTQAINLEPKNAWHYISRGDAYLEKKDYDKAFADYTQAINLSPKDGWYYYKRGNAYFDKKDYDKAIVDFTQAINLEPKYTNHYISRGNAYFDKKDYDKAIADYTQVINLKPKNDWYYNWRALAYEKKGDKNRAIADFQSALKINPDSKDGSNNLKRIRGW